MIRTPFHQTHAHFWLRVELLLLLVLGVLALAACSLATAERKDSTTVERTESLELHLLRSNGLDLPDDTVTETLAEIPGTTGVYRVIRYGLPGFSGIQIANGNSLVTDQDLAFQILLTLAWHETENRVTDANRAALEELHAELDQAQTQSAAIFELAHGLEPVLDAVDKLRDRPINGPRIEIKGLTLFEINDVWDAVCSIPIDATTACLLEPVLREIRDQGIEVEALLETTNADLGNVLVMLRAQERGQIQDGIELKARADKAWSSLANLRVKVQELDSKVLTAQALNLGLLDGLKNKKWGGTSTKFFQLLQRIDPAFDIQKVSTELIEQSEQLDLRLDQFHQRVGVFEGKLQRHMNILGDVRFKTDERVQVLGYDWRARPSR